MHGLVRLIPDASVAALDDVATHNNIMYDLDAGRLIYARHNVLPIPTDFTSNLQIFHLLKLLVVHALLHSFEFVPVLVFLFQ